jgi:hypothetical protein
MPSEACWNLEPTSASKYTTQKSFEKLAFYLQVDSSGKFDNPDQGQITQMFAETLSQPLQANKRRRKTCFFISKSSFTW